jgi:DNA polymerase I-like protein with 3'-5' exonuclease and polymerase domains
MDVYTIDLETYYAKDYSLTKLTTEEYINDPRFEVIGLAVKKNDCTVEWYSGDDIDGFLKGFDFSESMIVCHNTMFDAAILAWKYGVNPKVWADTMSMARFVHGLHESASLAALSEKYGAGVKGTEVTNALGKKRQNFTPSELARYGEYCVNDVDLTYRIFVSMVASGFPLKELKIIDITLRMFIEPTLEIDSGILASRLRDVRDEKQAALASLQDELGADSTEEVRKQLASNKKFSALIAKRGIPIPMKLSPTTGKEIPAVGKKDSGFIDLQNNEDEFVQLLCSVRLGTKSTMEEGRIEKFMQIAGRNDSRLPIPLNYCGAHTSRWSGKESINLQNLPSRDKKKKALKNAIVAPSGFVVVDCDSSQIEARILAWLAGQDDIIEAFANKKDVYRLMGSAIYKKLPEDITTEERFISKTVVLGCLAEGTLVLCDGGWKPIEQVTTEDKVWDGQNWVKHQGLLKKGLKETLNLCGLWLTPDHKVLCGTEWKDAQSVHQDANTLYRTLVTGAESWSSLGMWRESIVGYAHSSLNVTAEGQSTRSTITTSRTSKVQDVIRAPLQRLMKLTGKAIGSMRMQWPTTHTGKDFSTVYPQLLLGATTHRIMPTVRMEAGGYLSAKNGVMISEPFYNMFSYLMGGTSQSTKWTGPTMTRGTNPETFDSSHAEITLETVEKYLSCNQEYKNLRRNLMTYDLAFAGPQNRFTVFTNAGPIIVHNCGFGTGWKKLKAELKASGVDMPDEECKGVISTYREKNDKIVAMWGQAERALKDMARGNPYSFGIRDCISFESGGVTLPSGYTIRYPGLDFKTVDGKTEYFYKSRKGELSIWSGTLVENVVQGLARCVVAEQMLLISRLYRPVLTVHDAVAILAPEDEKDKAVEFIESCMRHVPKWAAGCPIACESGVGYSYGDC